MQPIVALCSICFVILGCAGSRTGDHPIADVIGMLKELSAQAVAEGKNEEVAFAKFQHWCSTSTKALIGKLDKDREEGRALYEKTSADLQATIDAVEEAIKVISESRGANLLQL